MEICRPVSYLKKLKPVSYLNMIQVSVDISVMDTGKYRKLVLTGEISRPGWSGSGKNICSRS